MARPVEHAFSGFALRDYALAQLRRAIACFGWRGGRMHAGVHQGRKSLRRTRAVLAMGGERLGPGAGLIDRELRRICRSLSDERDAQALVETLDRLLPRARADAMRLRLRRARRVAAAARAGVMRDALGDDPGLGRRRATLRVLLAALPALEWDALDAGQVHAGLARSRERIAVAAGMALRSDKPTHWHRLRRRVRRLAQQCTALDEIGLGGLIGERPDRHLATALGRAQDLDMLRVLCGRHSPFDPPDREPIAALAADGLARARAGIAARLTRTSAAGQASPPQERGTA